MCEPFGNWLISVACLQLIHYSGTSAIDPFVSLFIVAFLFVQMVNVVAYKVYITNQRIRSIKILKNMFSWSKQPRFKNHVALSTDQLYFKCTLTFKTIYWSARPWATTDRIISL